MRAVDTVENRLSSSLFLPAASAARLISFALNPVCDEALNHSSRVYSRHLPESYLSHPADLDILKK